MYDDFVPVIIVDGPFEGPGTGYGKSTRDTMEDGRF